MTCSHFPSCGGCKTQNISYQDQLREKQAFVEGLFPEVQPIVPCTTPWHYRNKMEFSFSQNKAGEKFLGLILKQSRGKVFNLHECLIGPKEFPEILAKVRAWWENSSLRAFHFRSGEGTLRTLTLRQSFYTGEKLALLTVSGNPTFAIPKRQIDEFVEAINEPSLSIFLQIQQAIAGRPTQFFEMHLAGPTHIVEELHVEGRTFRFNISPTSFFQPNTQQAEVLYQIALSLPQLPSTACVYDLYCGTGTLGIVAAPRVGQVIGIEINPHAIFDGQLNAAFNGVNNITFYRGDVAQVLAEQTLPKPDLIILDPPRVGLDKAALEVVRALQPEEILYISCNPVTQAQNIAELPSYTLTHVQPVDQFPHTPHIENVCLLRNKLN